MTTRDEMIEELTDMMADGYYALHNAEAIVDGTVELSGGARLAIVEPVDVDVTMSTASPVLRVWGRAGSPDGVALVDSMAPAMGAPAVPLFRAWQPEGEDR